MSLVDNRARVAVTPATAVESHARLLAALTRAFEVDFVPAQEGERFDALVSFRAEVEPAISVPTLLVHTSGSRNGDGDRVVAFGPGPNVPRAFAGRRLREEATPIGPIALVNDEAEILATVDDAPVWTRDTRTREYRTAIAPVELTEGETLRAQFRPGRFMSLLPLVEFLRDVVGYADWDVPQQRACFVFDDPNLHASRYGFIRYDELSRHAAEVGYHAAMAMVPLDAWYAAPSARNIFREHSDVLSLTVHGIDHVARELDRGEAPERLRRSLAQALRRITKFEWRYAIPVSRVMIAPHGRCSTTALEQMLRIGFDGVSLEWPYWWLDADEDVLAGWEPADATIGGVPVLPRHHLARSSDEIVLRAYLRQPLIVYGHHGDVADTLDTLERTADLINGLGTTEWCELRRISETNHRIRRGGDGCAVLQSFSARARVTVPDDAERLVLLPPAGARDVAAARWLVTDGEQTLEVEPSREVSVRPGASLIVRLASHGAVDYSELPVQRLRPWSIARRALVEGRDRARPKLSRVDPRRRWGG